MYFRKCWTLLINVSSFAPIKGRFQCYASLHCKEYEHLPVRTCNICNTDIKILYIDWPLEEKQQIIPKKSGDLTQPHVFVIYW